MRAILLAAGLWLLAMGPAFAACSGPAGSTGDVIYSADYHVPQYCNGVQWVAMGSPGVSSTIDKGLIHYWKLNESAGATTAADSAGTMTLSKTGTADFTTSGQVGNALDLPADATRKSFSATSAADMLGKRQITMSAWMRRAAVNEIVDVGQEDPDNSGDEIAIEAYSNGNIYFSISNSAAAQTYGHYASNDTAWHMVTMVFDGTQTGNANRLKAYLDGVQQTVTFDNTPIPTATTTTARTFYLGDMGAGYNDAGAIDEVRVYGRALSASEVLDLYNWSKGNVAPSSGLVNYWKFNESSGSSAADSVGGATGNLLNGASFGTGIIDGAVFIDASDDGDDFNNPHIDLNTSYSLTVPFTLAAWVKPTNYNDWRTIFGKRSLQDQGEFLWQLHDADGTVLIGSTATNYNFTYSPPTGSWTHLAIVATADTTTLYVNGILEEQQGGFAIGTCPAPCHANIGDNGEIDSGISVTYDGDPFKGYIDDFRVYSRELSPAEVAALYNYSGAKVTCSGPSANEGDILYNGGTQHVLQYCGVSGWQALGPVPGAGGAGCSSPSGSEGDIRYNATSAVMQYCDGTSWRQMPYSPFANLAKGVVGWLKFDEGSGTGAADSSGNGNTGTLTSGPTWTTGKVGSNAVAFDNNDDSVVLANESNFDFDRTSPFSISAWVFRQSNTTEDDVVEKYNTSAGSGWYLWFPPSTNSLYFGIANNTSVNISVFTNSAVSTGAWHHVVSTYDGSSSAAGVTLYVDGARQDVTLQNDNLNAATLNNDPVAIGNEGSGHVCCSFDGKIDDVRIFNRVLSEAEVRELYAQ